MTVVGVDGWRRGWVVAVATGRSLAWHVHDMFGDVLGRWGDATIAVDIPITTTDGTREVDEAGRAFLRERNGPWQSIFLAPTTATVAAWERHGDHARAMAERGATAGTSIQAWNLIPKIVEVRDALAARPGTRVIEAHPECSFRLLEDRIGRASKKTGRGAGLRLRALSREMDVDLAAAPDDVPVDDLLDAAVLTWTASRYDRGEHLTLPAGATAAPRIVV